MVLADQCGERDRHGDEHQRRRQGLGDHERHEGRGEHVETYADRSLHHRAHQDGDRGHDEVEDGDVHGVPALRPAW